MKFYLSKLIFVSLTFSLLTSTSCSLWAMGGKRANAPEQDDAREKSKKRPSHEKIISAEAPHEDDIPLMERMPPAAQNSEETEETSHEDIEEGRSFQLPSRPTEEERNPLEVALKKRIQVLYNSPMPNFTEFTILRRDIPECDWTHMGLSSLPSKAPYVWKLPFLTRPLTYSISPDLISDNTTCITGDKNYFILQDQGVLNPEEILLLGIHTLEPLSMTDPESYDDLYKSLISLIINRVNAHEGPNAHRFWKTLMGNRWTRRPSPLVSKFLSNFLPHIADIDNKAIVSAFTSWSMDSNPDQYTGHFLTIVIQKRFPLFSRELIKDFLLHTHPYALQKVVAKSPIAVRLNTLKEELGRLDNPEAKYLYSVIQEKLDTLDQEKSIPPHLKNVKFPNPLLLRFYYKLIHEEDQPLHHFSKVLFDELEILFNQHIELTADHLRKAGLWEIYIRTAGHFIDPQCSPQQKFYSSLWQLLRRCEATSHQLEQLGLSTLSLQILNAFYPGHVLKGDPHHRKLGATAATQPIIKEEPLVAILSSEPTNPQASRVASTTLPIDAVKSLLKKRLCTSALKLRGMGVWDAFVKLRGHAKVNPSSNPQKEFRISGLDLLKCGATTAQLKELGASPLALKSLNQHPAPIRVVLQKVTLPVAAASPSPQPASGGITQSSPLQRMPTKIAKKMTNPFHFVPPKKRKSTGDS
ncbi:MAG: hypothetical protein K2P93_09475 [Alphaproteobacteria bacterium]|nr:hypothetical protein [Alphaproteobacteria bacterium]